MIPESPSRITIGKRSRDSPTARSKSPPGVPKSSTIKGAMSTKIAVRQVVISRIEPEDRRCDAPRSSALTLFEQLAEDRDEGARERRVRDERSDEVRDLEGDREGVDLPGRAERVRSDDLANEPEHAREAGRGAEDRGRPRQAAAVRTLLREGGVDVRVERRVELGHPGEFRGIVGGPSATIRRPAA